MRHTMQALVWPLAVATASAPRRALSHVSTGPTVNTIGGGYISLINDGETCASVGYPTITTATECTDGVAAINAANGWSGYGTVSSVRQIPASTLR